MSYRVKKLIGALEDAMFKVSVSYDKLIIEKHGHKISYYTKNVEESKSLTNVFFEIEEMMDAKICFDEEAM